MSLHEAVILEVHFNRFLLFLEKLSSFHISSERERKRISIVLKFRLGATFCIVYVDVKR